MTFDKGHMVIHSNKPDNLSSNFDNCNSSEYVHCCCSTSCCSGYVHVFTLQISKQKYKQYIYIKKNQ